MREFSLIEEPWICVLDADGKTDTVSLFTLFEHMQDYEWFCGENELENIAVFRMALAIVYQVFSQVDAFGNPDTLTGDVGQAIERWKSIWEMGHFPMGPIHDYFVKWRDRFYLYDDEHPFYQVPEAALPHKNGEIAAGFFSAAKLDCTLVQSENRPKILAGRNNDESMRLTDAEAARCLVYLQGFDDAAVKPKIPKSEDRAPTAPGYLGRIPLIRVMGRNLFETMMFHWVMLDENGKSWDYTSMASSESELDGIPPWELAKPRTKELVKVHAEYNPVGLLTIQGRRVSLCRDDRGVYGFYEVQGDYLYEEYAQMEFMTLWAWHKKKNTWVPNKDLMNASYLWKDLDAVLGTKNSGRKPGIVRWMEQLKRAGVLDKSRYRTLQYQRVMVEYGSKGCSVARIYQSEVSLMTRLLEDGYKDVYLNIQKELELCVEMAGMLGYLAERLWLCAFSDTKNHDRGKAKREAAAQAFYQQANGIVLKWLYDMEGIDEDDIVEYCLSFREQLYKLVLSLGKELVSRSGERALIGRKVTYKNKTVHESSERAWSYFLYELKEKTGLDWEEGDNVQEREEIREMADMVTRHVARKINYLSHAESGRANMMLANLRCDVGKSPDQATRSWQTVFGDAPGPLIGTNGPSTEAEWAVFLTLTLFAMCSQGKHRGKAQDSGMPLGRALAGLNSPGRTGDTAQSCFDRFIRCQSITRLSMELQKVCRLFYAKGIGLDFIGLSRDIYLFQYPESRAQVKQNWGRAFYKNKKESDI